MGSSEANREPVSRLETVLTELAESELRDAKRRERGLALKSYSGIPTYDPLEDGDEASGSTVTTSHEPKPQSPTDKLKPSQVKAYSHYQAALSRDPHLSEATDKEVYDFICENMLDEGEKIPLFPTWSRQMRAARTADGRRRNTARAGRAHGGSIVPQHQI